MTILVVAVVALALFVAVVAVISGLLWFVEAPVAQSSQENIKAQKIQPKSKGDIMPIKRRA